MARKKGTHHRRQRGSSSSAPVKRHHRRYRMSDGGRIMDGWVPSLQQIEHGAISGAAYQGLRILASWGLLPLLSTVPAPWNFVIAEVASGYGVFAAARLLLKGQMQHDVQVGAVAITTNAVTSLTLTPAINKALGISGYGAVAQPFARQPINGYGKVGINGYGRAAISGGGQASVSDLTMMQGGRRSGVGGYRSQYAIS